MKNIAPLKSSFMLAAMLGFMITVIYTSYGRISPDWGFALGFLFAVMFVASIVSMTNAPIDMQLEMSHHHRIIKPKKKRSTTRRSNKTTTKKKKK